MLETAFAAGCLQATPLAIERKSAIHAGVIDQAARRYHLDRELIQAVIAVESCFNSRAVSPAGAEGLMQLMPATAERFGVSDSFNSKQNILAGARYLAWLKRRFAGNLQHAVAAYNAGEGVVAQYGGIPPYKETQRYVKNVMSIYSKLAPDKAVKHRKTIANGTVYFPYAPLNKVARHRQSGRVHMAVPKPAPLKPLTGKPGRQGIEYMRRHAPHLFRK
ncbi:MAG: hypothetical protein CSB47_06815 [Proteobacteria bacterium]|nr:MAG: hypothetical protein CSB47_06815 [Pseudomonadota bacterium]